MKTPIIFFGTEDFSAVSLQKLIDDNFNIVAIITKADSKKGRGQKTIPPKVKTIGKNYNIPVLQPTKIDEIADFIKKIDNPVGILVSYGRIIPQKIIDLFTPGIINVHPSLLPKYRGPSPIESAIINGDKKTGVSIMALSKDMDAGPVYKQVEINLTGHEYASDLYQTLAKIGAVELTKALESILLNKMTPRPQEEDRATYCRLLSKSDAFIDPKKITAGQAYQHIRAYNIFPRTKMSFGGLNCIITKASPSLEPTKNTILMANKTHLDIQELIAPSGKKMPYGDFKKGYLKTS